MDELFVRMAILVELATRKQSLQGRLGKTALQKLVYLLQEIFDVNVGYRFELYTYGPYCSRLMQDIDYAEALGLLSLEYDHTLGYEISPGKNVPEIDDELERVRDEAGDNLRDLMKAFGTLTARKLELRGTLIFAAKDEQSEERTRVVDLVTKIKPKYEASEVEAAFTELEAAGFLKKVCRQ